MPCGITLLCLIRPGFPALFVYILSWRFVCLLGHCWPCCLVNFSCSLSKIEFVVLWFSERFNFRIVSGCCRSFPKASAKVRTFAKLASVRQSFFWKKRFFTALSCFTLSLCVIRDVFRRFQSVIRGARGGSGEGRFSAVFLLFSGESTKKMNN